MRATLSYHYDDDRWMFLFLSHYNVEIIKTMDYNCIDHRTVIKVKDTRELNQLLFKANEQSKRGVKVIKTSRYDGFTDFVKHIVNEIKERTENYDESKKILQATL